MIHLIGTKPTFMKCNHNQMKQRSKPTVLQKEFKIFAMINVHDNFPRVYLQLISPDSFKILKTISPAKRHSKLTTETKIKASIRLFNNHVCALKALYAPKTHSAYFSFRATDLDPVQCTESHSPPLPEFHPTTFNHFNILHLRTRAARGRWVRFYDFPRKY